MTARAVWGAALLACFALLGALVSGAPNAVDEWFAAHLGGDYLGLPGQVAGAVSVVLGPVLPVALGVGLVVAAGIDYYAGRVWRALLLVRVLVVLIACRVVSFVKPLFGRERPRDYPDFSFPSGHVTSVAAVAFAVVLLCVALAPAKVRLAAVLGGLGVVVIAVCRVVLDVHWFTDTAGAVVGVLGAGLLASAAVGLPLRRGGVAAEGSDEVAEEA
ncbi:phosphatase PAP2 family protein [Actinokineospora bangkokensis]|uniref:Phosphatidic acid phosphatase type 2/haloperoxidase domain-containing protein n=1 Tax=Actinokineospora bangkokensis TaxID=1193682 RepID=A0A1Q9LTA0_9PSEU|nr:phosphatase PAP2 family protein [Actinokineospora bangkokensis]OLR95250.1 hypothetical protein BJP25_07115 [Actinokineospora bangkokensis]